MADTIFTFKLPDIGEGVVEGEVIEWLKQVGDAVRKDEPVVTVMTDKATVELPAPYPGIISQQYYRQGEIAIKDKPLYDIRLEPGILMSGHHSEIPAASVPKKNRDLPPKPIESCTSTERPRSGKALAVPRVRHMAQELGIDLDSIAGTGKDGRVTLEDLSRKQPQSREKLPFRHLENDQEQPLMGIRGLMARRMDQVHIPQFSYFEQVDATRLIQLRDSLRPKTADEGIKLNYMPFFIRALSLVAKLYPQMNSSVDMQRNMLVLHQQLNVGTAMATPQGLIVPVLKQVEGMSLEGIIKSYETLKNLALAGKLTSSDMKDATITLSNFGMLGEGKWATPMISHPEVAILAVARISKTPVVKNGEIIIRDLLPLSWSFDHRVIDGELAAKISHEFCKLLRDPAALV